MTREENLDWLYRLKSEIFVFMPKEWLIPMADALDDAIKALEQEPFKPMVEIDLYSVIKQKYIEREVLDKIRAEIEVYTDPQGFITISEGRFNSILDKYKAETEADKGNDD